MHIALRFLLLAGAAVSAGILINFFLLYLFHKQDFQRQLESIKRLGSMLHNPLINQKKDYSDLHHAVSSLGQHEKTPHDQTCDVDYPASQ